MSLIFNIDLDLGQGRNLENVQCHESHFVKISNNFVRECSNLEVNSCW